MKRHRLWIAAPVLAFSLLVLPVINAEAASDTALQSEAIFAEIIENDRTILNNTIITEKEAVEKIAADLAANKPSTTFTFKLKTGENSGNKIQSLIEQAKATNEYVYGVGAGYGYLGSTMTTGNETQVTVHLYYSYHLLNSEFKSFNFKNDADIRKHAADVAIVQQREQEITNYVKEAAAKLFTKDMNEFEKVKAAYDYIILNTKYGKTNTQGFGKGHSPYSIVKEGVGVCQAYALLFQRLMDEAGVESKYVIGERVVGKTADGKIVKEGHAWNVVTIGGQTYHIDATHGDPIGNHLSEDFISYQTFLLSEAKILQHGHIITEKRPYVKPVSEQFSQWHEVSEPLEFNGSIYYTVLESTYIGADKNEYGIYAFKKGTVNSKTGAMTSKKLTFGEGTQIRNVMAEHATIFNNKIFFSNYNDGARLWTLDADGTYDLMRDLYNEGKNGLPQVGAIKIVNDELLAYDYSNPNTVVYREKQKAPELPIITGPVTEEQIAEMFTANSPTVQAIEVAKSQEAFEQLLKQLASFVGAESDNPLLVEFKQKVEGFNEAKKKVAETKPWVETLPAANPNKSWTIEFSEELGQDGIKSIYVTDIFNSKITVSPAINGKFVTVTPEKPYEKGATYYLIIPAGVKSAAGEPIKEAISVAFTPQ
ncbi:MAG: transglutaminase domain-containing protein [Caryophanon sp.]|nr:transglutaminase domain-containing protein [Caryophanon sp.]